jgi:hypothetical protein
VVAALGEAGGILEGVRGTVVAATDRRREGTTVDGPVEVGAWEAVVVRGDG